MLKRLILSAAMVLGLAAGASAQDPVKIDGPPNVAFIYLSPVNDGGWTQSLDRGRTEMDKALGIDSAYSEDVAAEKSKVRQVIDLYVQRGRNVIIGSAWDYGEAFADAAKAYPNVAFLNAAGETSGPNLESFYARTYQGWYLAGMAAAGVSKSKKIGIVAGFPLSVVNWDINAFQRGAQAIDPNVKVIAGFVNTWFDPLKEGQAAQAMIEQGADVIATDLSAASVPTATEKAGVRFIGFQNDMSALAPKGHVVSVVFNWDKYLTPTVKKIKDGTWTSSGSAFVGIDQDMIGLAGMASDVPKDVQDKINAAKEAMAAGKLTPFDGPMKKQDGTEVVAAGKSLDDASIWKMDYFVDGIIGTMPAK